MISCRTPLTKMTVDQPNQPDREMELRSQLIDALWELYVRRAMTEKMATQEEAFRYADTELARQGLI